jgi:MscS family membrane protein
MLKILVTLIILLLTFPAVSGFAAQKPGALSQAREKVHPAGEGKNPEDLLGRNTPKETVLGFLKSATQREYDQALPYLDTKKTGASAHELIDALRIILDRSFSAQSSMLNNQPEGNLEDNLPPNKERIGRVKTTSGSLEILLERIQRGDSPPIWLFSAETLAQVPAAYQELGVSPLEAHLPKPLVDTWFLWFPLWQWFLILLMIPLSWGVAALLTRLFTALVWVYSRRRSKGQAMRPEVRITGPVRILIFASAIWIISLLSHSVLTGDFCVFVAATLAIVGATWLCFPLTDIFFELREKRLAAASPERKSLLQLVERLVKILVLIIGTVSIFSLAGVNLTAVIAGLGIGGIAVALAAQKTLENLIGGINIVSDHPIRVGDFCRAGDSLGRVQAVGLRSTRIRTTNRTIVSIPNGHLATISLENFSLRDKSRFHHTFGLRYETTTDQLRYILAGIREMLYGHPKVDPPSARVRFVGFGNSSLNLEAHAYVAETGYGDFLKVQEDLLMRIMDIVRASGSGFAFPSQTTYLAQDAGMDTGKTQEAILKVQEWREKGELPFPDFAPETIAKMKNRLGYPPPGSAQKNINP